MATDSQNPILVVGAGPTGLTMACELARHGVPVRIVDKRPQIDPHCRATGIHSRTLEVFHDLGIVDEAVAAGCPFLAFNEYANGRHVARHPTGGVDSPYPFTLSLEQCRTEEILEGLLTRLGLAVERQTELLALKEHPDRVNITLRHGDGREETVDTPWLVGCDGAHSTVRHLTHQTFPGQANPHQYVLTDVILEGDVAPDEGHGFLHDTGVLYVFPLPRGRTLVVATLTQHHDEPTEPPTLDMIQALMAQRAPAGLRVSDPQWLSYFHIHYRLARHYRPGRRVFLAGDAAHVHSPVGGQGMNTGIQDAYNLAWKLALVARGLSPASLLDSYEVERRAVAKDVIKTTRMMTERFEAFGHLSAADRERLYVNVLLPEAEARRAAQHMEELDVDYRKSPICAEGGSGRRLAAGPHAGAEAPEAGPLRRADQRLTLFDLLRGPRHNLLLFPGTRSGSATWHRLARLADATQGVHSGLIDAHLVARRDVAVPSDLPAGTSVVVDAEGELHRRYGVQAESLYLIRPDGYVAYRSAPSAPSRLRDYLGRIFIPTR
jgi:2-polyprenyl-6-methoxyphenol hydroxylase-like FAD-dependent oxidoreductase